MPSGQLSMTDYTGCPTMKENLPHNSGCWSLITCSNSDYVNNNLIRKTTHNQVPEIKCLTINNFAMELILDYDTVLAK